VAIITVFLVISISNLEFFQHRKSVFFIFRIHFAAHFATPLTGLPWVAPPVAPSCRCACLMNGRLAGQNHSTTESKLHASRI